MANAPKQTRSDLTGYAALLGDSFSSRVDMLEQVIRGSHYPSLGRYKEKLLVKLIRDYIPRKFEVGTGFVLFPHEDVSPPGGLENHDTLNRSAFAISRQCDIMIFDSTDVPVIFRDDDFVVIRPESVRAVIEVKGSLSTDSLSEMLDSFYDFGTKWRTTDLFYKSHYQSSSPPPMLIGMAWKIKKSKGHVVMTPASIRQSIADFYNERMSCVSETKFPALTSLSVYNECCISRATWSSDASTGKAGDGWVTFDGRFIRFNPKNEPYRDKDKTIATLLASLQNATQQDGNFNRFFSYADESNRVDLIPYKYYGHSEWHRSL
jgi:hypothetical protein